MMILGFLFGCLIGAVLAYVFYRHKTLARVDELTTMVEKLNKQDYQINMAQDDFSKLEDSIYKLFLQTIEEREKTRDLYGDQARNLEDIAHQIKTPLTAMSFQLEMIGQEVEIEGLKKQVDRLNRLTDTLLKLSSLEAKLMTMKRDKIDLEEVVDYSLDILAGDIIEGAITIAKAPMKEELIGDYYWISEAVINILKNAIAVSNHKTIWISAKSNPIYTALVIGDQGGGIPEGKRKQIFQRFYKSPDSQGFGLGLAMAKSIVEANHGEIIVENTKEGAQFTLKFYHVT